MLSEKERQEKMSRIVLKKLSRSSRRRSVAPGWEDTQSVHSIRTIQTVKTEDRPICQDDTPRSQTSSVFQGGY
jgi:hypothetical protein